MILSRAFAVRDSLQSSASISFSPASLLKRADTLANAPAGHAVSGPYIYTFFSLLFLIIMGVLLGKRIEQLRMNHRHDIQPVRVLVLSIYVVAIAMVVGLSIMLQAQRMQSPGGCSAGIIVCLVGYLGTKMLLYLFLIERLHAFNYRQPRLKDKIWVGSAAVVLIGFGTIVGTAFTYPTSILSRDTGECYIGLSMGTLIALLGYDMSVNVALTVLFINFLLSPLRFRHQNSPASDPQGGLTHRLTLTLTHRRRNDSPGSPQPGPPASHGVIDAKSTQNIERLLLRSLTGLLLILLPTILNLAVVLHFQGHEPGWLCFTLCLGDVTFQVIIIHWLTRTPLDLASKIRLSEPRRPLMEPHKSLGELDVIPPAYRQTDPQADGRV